MRLIDADKLKQIIIKDYLSKELVEKLIDIQPTAYDVDKVINEIEERKLNLSRSIMLNSQEYDLDRAVKDAMIPYDNCLKFVKKGGLEE